MEKVLISACLLGERVRYNGIVKTFENQILSSWHRQGCVIAVCPEVAGGLPVPRPRAEIVNGDGSLVLDDRTRVININGQDVTQYFIEGAQKTLLLARFHKIKLTILKEGSPSCGSDYIYDGTFSGNKKQGKGVTCALLEENGIRVFSERKISEAERYLKLL
jgi:uncharacterized protein YbbK (DUF523 family)